MELCGHKRTKRSRPCAKPIGPAGWCGTAGHPRRANPGSETDASAATRDALSMVDEPADTRTQGACIASTRLGPCRLPAEDGSRCEPHIQDRDDDLQITTAIAAFTAAALAAEEAKHLGQNEQWAQACAQQLETAIGRTHAAVNGAEVAADECRQILHDYDTSGFRGDHRRMVDLAERVERLACDANDESERVINPGTASDVATANGMAQSLAAEIRGCRDAMKAIVDADHEDPTFDEMVQRSRAAAAEAARLVEQCQAMRDDEANNVDTRRSLAELAKDAKRAAREANYSAQNVGNAEALVREQHAEALEGLESVRQMRDRAASLMSRSG